MKVRWPDRSASLEQTEWESSRVEVHSHVILRLILREDCTRFDNEVLGGVEVFDRDVQVQHHLLIAEMAGPSRSDVGVLDLEGQAGSAVRID